MRRYSPDMIRLSAGQRITVLAHGEDGAGGCSSHVRRQFVWPKRSDEVPAHGLLAPPASPIRHVGSWRPPRILPVVESLFCRDRIVAEENRELLGYIRHTRHVRHVWYMWFDLGRPRLRTPGNVVLEEHGVGRRWRYVNLLRQPTAKMQGRDHRVAEMHSAH